MMLYYWLALVLIVGLMVGSFLNVCVARLPLEKSLVWPDSRCGSCQRPVQWYDNLPLLSYLWLRGRCRSCGAKFSIQYFLVELFTGLAFAGLFWLDVVENVHDWPDPAPWLRYFPFENLHWHFYLGFTYHAVLLSLLIAASVTDLNGREIPLPLTVTGTVIGLAGATLMPWPWPWSTAEFPLGALPKAAPPLIPNGWEWLVPEGGLREGIQPWPVWGPLPAFLAPGGSWPTGLATGFAGALAGTFLMRAIGFLFGSGLGREALGLGDADLMMMVGSFLGWQIVVVAIFVSVIPAACIGVIQLAVRRDNSLPFGPSLAAGSLLTYFGWNWRPLELQMLLFSWPFLAGLAAFGAVFLYLSARVIRAARSRETGK